MTSLRCAAWLVAMLLWSAAAQAAGWDAGDAAEPRQFPALVDDSQRDTVGNALQAVKDTARSFQQQVLGQSITLGAAAVLTGATLTTKGGTFESYDGPSLLTPTVAFNSSSASGVVLRSYDAGGFHFTDSISFLANYAAFDANHQTVQKLQGGTDPKGFLRGDYLYGVALFAYNGIHPGDPDWAFRAGAGLGAALAQIDGRLDYASGGQNRSETYSQAYDRLMLAYLLLVEGRIGHVVFGGQAIQMYDTVQTKQSKTKFLLDMAVVTFQVGYAVPL